VFDVRLPNRQTEIISTSSATSLRWAVLYDILVPYFPGAPRQFDIENDLDIPIIEVNTQIMSE